MVSVIICSKDENLFRSIEQNIGDTIGVLFEIIKIENANGEKSIFQAYNEGQGLAKHEILVYVHEDVIFHTKGWGQILVKYFAEISNLGCVGIAGALYKTKSPSSWCDVDEPQIKMHLLQHTKENEKHFINTGWEVTKGYVEVVVIDGVFMATKKLHKLAFDDSIPGFHCYDLNLCFEAKKRGLINIASNEILLEHFSPGAIDKQWVISTDKIHRKYTRLLPLSCNGVLISRRREVSNIIDYIMAALRFKLKTIAFSNWVRFMVLKPFSRFHFKIMKRLMFN